jgi:hypothetical protein
MRPRLLVFVLVPVLLGPRIGRAESVDAKERKARTACLGGDYAKGVQLLSELFVATLDATFIYDQGRCFQQNRRYDDAIARFQEYLRAERKVAKAAKAEAQKHIDECKELLAAESARSAQSAPSASPPVPDAPVPSISTTPPVVITTPPPVASPTDPSTASNSGSGLRVAGIAAASAGGAALLAGVIFNLKANSLATEIEKTNGYGAGKVDDRKTYETLGWIGYGAGAAFVATGALLYVLGSRSAREPSVAVIPVCAPEYAGALLKGHF